MEPTATTTPTGSPATGRFGREPQPNLPLAAAEAASPPSAAPAAQPGLAATRAIARRWPRSVPPKRVFPRG
jgi:hypothetical protein